MNPRSISATEIIQNFTFLGAVTAIEEALKGGLDPAADLQRSILPIEKGELLLMPATSAEGSGIKILTIAPNNPALNQPRIQGVYILFDKENLSISSLLDGAALTTYRTPAISFAAIRQALELSTTTHPTSAKRGAHSKLTSPPAEKSARSGFMETACSKVTTAT